MSWTLIIFTCAMVSLTFGSERVFYNGIQGLIMVFFCAFVVQNYYLKSKSVLVNRLNQALGEIKTLQGLLPICANCRKIRDQGGSWEVIEAYLARHTKAKFTHSLCPDCVRALYPEISNKILAGVAAVPVRTEGSADIK